MKQNQIARTSGVEIADSLTTCIVELHSVMAAVQQGLKYSIMETTLKMNGKCTMKKEIEDKDRERMNCVSANE